MTAALNVMSGQQRRPGRILLPGKRTVTILQGRSGRAENLVPTGIRSRTVQPVAQTPYRLSYQAHSSRGTEIIF